MNTTADSLFSAKITNLTTAKPRNGTAATTCAFNKADVKPNTIPHAANAAIGIIKLLPRFEKN